MTPPHYSGAGRAGYDLSHAPKVSTITKLDDVGTTFDRDFLC
jgi:hypothetical protein